MRTSRCKPKVRLASSSIGVDRDARTAAGHGSGRSRIWSGKPWAPGLLAGETGAHWVAREKRGGPSLASWRLDEIEKLSDRLGRQEDAPAQSEQIRMIHDFVATLRVV